MPLPNPSQNEKNNEDSGKQAFMSRCLNDKNVKSDFKSHTQQVAVCLNLYKQAKKKKAKGNVIEEDWDEISKQKYWIF